MAVELRELLRVHSCAFNGRDVETFAAHTHPQATCFCDGEYVGEGPDGVRQLLEREFERGEWIAKVEQVQGEDVLVEFSPDGRQRHGLVRVRGQPDGRIREVRIEHGPVVRANVPEPGR